MKQQLFGNPNLVNDSEQDVELPDVEEASVRFKKFSDRKALIVTNEDGSIELIKINGYDLNVGFNMKYLRSMEEIEAACEGIKELFRKVIMQELLAHTKLGREIIKQSSQQES